MGLDQSAGRVLRLDDHGEGRLQVGDARPGEGHAVAARNGVYYTATAEREDDGFRGWREKVPNSVTFTADAEARYRWRPRRRWTPT